MRCSACGTEVGPDDTFCPECGLRISGEKVEKPPAKIPSTGGPPPSDALTPEPSTGGAQQEPQDVVAPPEGPRQPSGMPPPPPSAGKKTSAWAVASLILGIAGFVVLPFISAILAIVFAGVAKSEIKRTKGQIGGSGLSTAGLVLGIIGVVLPIVIVAAAWPIFHSVIRPGFEARYRLARGVEAAEVYYVNNGNSYEGMNARELRPIDPDVQFEDAPGGESEVVYIEEADESGAELYCRSTTSDTYAARALGSTWTYNFHFDEDFIERWGRFRDWYPFD